MARNKALHILPSTALTAGTGTVDKFNREGRGIQLVITTTAITGTLVVKLQGKSASGTYFDIPGATTASITATGTVVLTVLPGVTSSANVGVSQPVPAIYRVSYTTTGTVTTAIDANELH